MIKISEEDYKILNRRLVDKYGVIEDKPYFRLRWSEDLLEKRWMTHTNEGFELLNPEVREVKKYGHYIRDRYVLEGLNAVPFFGQGDDRIEQVTYEPVFVFEDKHGNYLPPRWDVIWFVLENLRNCQEHNTGTVKYRDPESTPEEAAEAKLQRLKAIEEYLWGNETQVTDALTYGQGVVVPHNFTTQKES